VRALAIHGQRHPITGNPASIGFSSVVRFGIDEVVTREYWYVWTGCGGSITSAIVMSLQPVASQSPYDRS
jgi:hypothetical protein